MSGRPAAKEARERLYRIGKTVSDVAKELDVSHGIVRAVLSGRLRGDYGDAHKVAVALGIKDGLIVPDGTSLAEAMKAAAR